MKKRICKCCGELLHGSFFGHYYSSNCKLCSRLKEATELTDNDAKKYAKVIQGIQDRRTIPHQMTWGQLKQTELYKKVIINN